MATASRSSSRAKTGIELFPEALGRGRVISGFLLEGELQENARTGSSSMSRTSI